jgi:4-amino-4-deoxy-L-arabinose transferase-like glycosyltransferase
MTRLAFIDMTALFFSCLTVYCVLLALKTRNFWTSGALIGLGLGCACGSKVNAGLIGVVGIAAAILLLIRHREQWREYQGFLKAMAVGGVLSLIVFIAPNPALYDGVVGGVRDLVTEHQKTQAVQAVYLGGSLESFSEGFEAVGLRVIGSRWYPGIIDPITAAIGPELLGEACGDSVTVVAVWCLISVAVVALWIPFDWARYSLPVLPPVLLALCMTIGQLWRMRTRKG